MKKNSKIEVNHVSEKNTYVNEAMFVGYLWNTPSLYEIYKVYEINRKTFSEAIWYFYYHVGKEMYESGIKTFDDVNTYAFILKRPIEFGKRSYLECYNDFNGFETIGELMDECEKSKGNDDYHFNEIKKNSSMRERESETGIEIFTEDENELQVMNPYFCDNKFMPEKHAKDMLEILKGVFDGQLLWHYENGYYKNDGEAQFRVIGQKLLGEKSKKVHINESYYFATQDHRLLGGKTMNPTCSLINLKNGMMNPNTGELLPHSPEYFSTAQLSVEYDPEANDPIIHKFISDVLPVDAHNAVYEMVGYMLTNDLHLEKSFMLTGTGSNGKSVLIDLISSLIGQENISSVSLQDLDHRFRLGGIEGKLLNAFSDLPQRPIEDTGNFKAIVSHEYITIEHKNKDPKRIKPTCKLLFSANHLVTTPDMSDGYFRRWLIFEFKHKLKDSEIDIHLLEKLITPKALSTLLNKAIEGLRRLYQNEKFSESKSNVEAINKYKLSSDCVASFINECCLYIQGETIIAKHLYRGYRAWCVESGLVPLSKIKFGQRMNLKKGRKFNQPEHWEGIAWADRLY